MKTKVIELLYSWTVALPEESKIKDAYYMLKRQGRKSAARLHVLSSLSFKQESHKCTASVYMGSRQALRGGRIRQKFPETLHVVFKCLGLC